MTLCPGHDYEKYYGSSCVHKIDTLKSQSTVPQNVTLFTNRVFAEVIKLKMRSLEWVLFQFDWYPCKKEKLDTEICKEDHMKRE